MTDESEGKSKQVGWISLSKAAAMLGVHSMTLRRWSDNGKFPSYRTPGGHRRFALNDIEAYLDRNQVTPAETLPAAWADQALIQTRQQVANHRDHRWLQMVDEGDMRNDYRQLGHQLIGLLLQYVAADEPNGALLEEAKRFGRLYGAYGKRSGMTLSSIIEATLFFRDILVESSLQIPSNTYVEPGTSLRILRRVNQIINTVQLAVTEFYEFSNP
jgi:excisionase family DNA binding protein